MTALCIAVAIDSIGAGVILPIFTDIFIGPDSLAGSDSLGVQQLYLAVAIAMYPAGMLVGAPILGHLSDRFGRRRLMIIALVGGALASVVSGATVAGGSLFLLFASRIVAGFFAGNMALARAAVADLYGPENRFVHMSTLSVAANGAFIVSPIIGGSLSVVDPAVPFLIVAAMGLASAALVALLMPEGKRSATPAAQPSKFRAVVQMFGDARVRPEILAYLAQILGWNIFFQFSSALLTVRFGADTQELGVFLALVGAYSMVASFLVARLLDRWMSVGRIVNLSLIIMIPSVLIFGYTELEWLVWLMVLPLSMGKSLASSGIATRSSQLVDEHSQGSVAGSLSAMMAIGWIAGPLIGALGGFVGLAFTFVIAAAMFVIAIAFFTRGKVVALRGTAVES